MEDAATLDGELKLTKRLVKLIPAISLPARCKLYWTPSNWAGLMFMDFLNA